MNLDSRRAGRLAALILGAGLLLRFAYAWRGAHALPTSNDQYETIALSVVEHGEYAVIPGVPTSGREPVYPLFIAGLYKVFGERPSVVIFVQCVLSMLTGYFLWLTGRRLFDERLALAALAVYMLYPQSVYYCAYFFRETLLCFGFGVLLWSSLDWGAAPGDPGGDRSALIGGLSASVFGIGNSAVLPACALSGLLIWAVAPAKSRARRFFLYTAPLVLFFAAWTGRNWAVQGRFIAGSTHGGEEFYRALVVPPEYQTTNRVAEFAKTVPIFAEAELLPEADRNTLMTKAAFAWIGAHRAKFAARIFEGVVKFWRLWPYKMATYQHSYALLVLASLLSDGWIIPLGLLGLWLFRDRWREIPVLPASVFGLTVVYGTVHAVIRYRLPLMQGLILLACAAISRLFAPGLGRIFKVR
ncbi:MAG: glycosyltransferase family 39 protein, partial [Elusimicrobia bacterium]|nr:glycosyltransferase family 39 protein [Elusimicrobiota bacterium]